MRTAGRKVSGRQPRPDRIERLQPLKKRLVDRRRMRAGEGLVEMMVSVDQAPAGPRAAEASNTRGTAGLARPPERHEVDDAPAFDHDDLGPRPRQRMASGSLIQSRSAEAGHPAGRTCLVGRCGRLTRHPSQQIGERQTQPDAANANPRLAAWECAYLTIRRCSASTTMARPEPSSRPSAEARARCCRAFARRPYGRRAAAG